MNAPIILPFPDARLSPNARLNRYALNIIKQEARQIGQYAARETGLKLPKSSALQMFVRINAPDNRGRDADNILASLKSQIDGIFDALDINDKNIRLITHGFGKTLRGGAVLIWIEPLVNIPEWLEAQ